MVSNYTGKNGSERKTLTLFEATYILEWNMLPFTSKTLHVQKLHKGNEAIASNTYIDRYSMDIVWMFTLEENTPAVSWSGRKLSGISSCVRDK